LADDSPATAWWACTLRMNVSTTAPRVLSVSALLIALLPTVLTQCCSWCACCALFSFGLLASSYLASACPHNRLTTLSYSRDTRPLRFGCACVPASPCCSRLRLTVAAVTGGGDQLFQKAGEDWRPREGGVVLEAPEGRSPFSVLEAFLKEGRQRRLADFDDHLEDVRLDWTNAQLFA
jgi:hypothetical protein